MVTQEYTYAYTAVSVADGKMDSLILPQVNTVCMQILIKQHSFCKFVIPSLGFAV